MGTNLIENVVEAKSSGKCGDSDKGIYSFKIF